MPVKTIQILVSSLSTGAGDGAASSKTKFDPFKSCKLILVVRLVKQKKIGGLFVLLILVKDYLLIMLLMNNNYILYIYIYILCIKMSLVNFECWD